MGFDGAAGRLVELRERERRAQFEAARALLLRDGDGGQERFLRGRRVGGIVLKLKQHFAADAMQLRFERAMSDPLARRQRFVEDGEGAVDIAGTGFGFGESNLNEPVEDQYVLLAQKFDAATHGVEPAAGCAALGARQALEKDPERSPNRQIVLTREAGGFGGIRCGAREVAPHQLEHGRAPFPERAGTDVGEARDPRRSIAAEGNRALDVAQRPHGERQENHCRDAHVLPEAEGQIVVAPGLKQGQCTFQLLSSFGVLSSEPMRGPGYAVSDSCLGRNRDLASTSPRKVAAWARIAESSPRTKLPTHRP